MSTTELVTTIVAGALVVVGAAGLIVLAPRSMSNTRTVDIVSIGLAIVAAVALVWLVATR